MRGRERSPARWVVRELRPERREAAAKVRT